MNKLVPDSLLNQLPAHESIEIFPQAFSDSTHDLWRLENSDPDKPNYFLKVCSNTHSPFWQIMQDLFDYDLKEEIANFSKVYQFVNQACDIQVANLIKAEVTKTCSYILTTELKGNACNSELNDKQVIQLAKHMSKLHAKKYHCWGSLNNPQFNADDWPKRLRITIEKNAKKWGGVCLESNDFLKQAIEACNNIELTEFVPMIPDLRWDQFLEQNDSISALVDLDAFVFAPRSLDFVILEYLLLPAQLGVFKQEYLKHHSLPDIQEVRPTYRLLLFYMQILGENDLEQWMNQDKYF